MTPWPSCKQRSLFTLTNAILIAACGGEIPTDPDLLGLDAGLSGDGGRIQIDAGSGSGGSGGAKDAGTRDAGPSTCGAELFKSTRLAANMLIVLDRSGSMSSSASQNTSGPFVSKMKSAQDALVRVANTSAGKIFLGLSTYPSNSNSCGAGQVLVPIGPSSSNAIAAALPGVTPFGSTPTGPALQLAGTQAALKDSSRANYILLVTDGAEGCGGNSRAEVKKLADAGIKTYVVGFGDGVDSAALNDLATFGGTARPTGTTKYYQANQPAELQSALDAIAAGAVGCNYKLGKAPPDVNKLYVYVGGTLQSRDASHATGWDYNAATNAITLYGTTCETVTKNAATAVNIVYGCPDSFLGETEPPSDAGVFQ